MAKFCKYCGSPLEEGQVCTCEGAVAEQQAPVAPVAPVSGGTGNGAALFNELKDVLLGGLKAPRQAASNLANSKNKMALAGILAGINGLSVFFLLWNLLSGVFGGVLGAATSAMGGLGAAAMNQIDISYPIFPMLLGGLLLAAAGIGICGLLTFVFAKLAKKDMNIVDCLVSAAADSIYPTVLLLAAVVFGFIGFVWQLLPLGILLVASIVNTVDNAQTVVGLNVKQTKDYLCMVIGILVGIVVVCFVAKLVALDWCLMAVEIEGMPLSEALEGLGSVTDALGSLFG